MHAVDAYELDMRERELAPATIARERHHLDVALEIVRRDAKPRRGQPRPAPQPGRYAGHYLTWLTPARAAHLYEAFRVRPTTRGKRPSVDTARNALAACKSFGRWCAKQGWLPSDPFAAIEPKGKRRRGKAQLGIDETRKLIDTCLAESSRASLAVATSVLLGCGASEVVQRQVRDLDDGGHVLHVTRGKNRYRVRSLEVPDGLRERLVELARGRLAASPLYGTGELGRPTRYWILRHCRRLCALAGVPVVSVHGLRGTHATLALGAVSTSHSVAAALAAAGASLGHAPDSPITASTYAAPGSVERATQRAALAVIQGGRR